MEEIRKSLSFISEDISKVTKQQTKRMELMDKMLIKEEHKKIEDLEKRIDDMEQ